MSVFEDLTHKNFSFTFHNFALEETWDSKNLNNIHWKGIDLKTLKLVKCHEIW